MVVPCLFNRSPLQRSSISAKESSPTPSFTEPLKSFQSWPSSAFSLKTYEWIIVLGWFSCFCRKMCQKLGHCCPFCMFPVELRMITYSFLRSLKSRRTTEWVLNLHCRCSIRPVSIARKRETEFTNRFLGRVFSSFCVSFDAIHCSNSRFYIRVTFVSDDVNKPFLGLNEVHLASTFSCTKTGTRKKDYTSIS